MWHAPANVTENPELHNRSGVFIDRADAGSQLAQLLENWRGRDVIVNAIPAGGVAVGIALSKALELPFDVLVVSKMTLPWNTEAGFGAMAADGTVQVNEALVAETGLDRAGVGSGIEATRKKVIRRERQYHRLIEHKPLENRQVIIVDDGLASGFTLRVAIQSARNRKAERVIVAVPTGHSASVEQVARDCDQLYCANIREGLRFAVADAYEHWSDVSEDEVLALLEQVR